LHWTGLFEPNPVQFLRCEGELMGKKAKEPGRHLGEFEPGEPATRKNSASIRRFFYDIVAEEFETSLLRAAAGLTKALNAAEDQRAYRRGFSQGTAYRVQHDEKTITFNQLDSMALYYEVPLALVLLFTRARSDLQHAPNPSKERALKTLRAFRKGLDALEEIVENMPPKSQPYQYLNHDKFKLVRSAFRDELDGEHQADLPLTPPG
jgi:hypothetical protein